MGQHLITNRSYTLLLQHSLTIHICLSDKNEWLQGERMTIHSKQHYDELLQNGFEVANTSFSYTPERTENKLILQKGEKTIITDANSIDEYVMHLQPLYDFNKKKIVFTPK